MAQFIKYPAISISTVTVSGTVAVSNFPATQAVSGTVTANTGLAQPLTDAQLRATAVPVSGTVTANTGLTQPLTDTQLRATAVTVTGPLTDTQLRATAVPISGTVTANTGLSQPLTDTQLRATAVTVTGPLTDTQLRATAVPVSGTFFQATQPVSATSLPLPTGAATETTLAALNTKVTTVNTGAVTISTALPAGSNLIGSVKQNGLSRANAPVFNNYASTSVTTAAYVQLVASSTATVNMVHVFDSSGQAMILAVGGAGSEVDQLYVPPGGGDFNLSIPAGSRVSIKALTANATSGYILVNLLG